VSLKVFVSFIPWSSFVSGRNQFSFAAFGGHGCVVRDPACVVVAWDMGVETSKP
jgi:hypothetical protein